MDGIEANLSEMDNSDSDEFYDACSESQEPDLSCDMDMDLKTSLQDAERAIDYFFNNQFEKARDLLRPFAHKSLYHSMGNAVFAFLEAVLTFEDIERASTELKKCLELCQVLRKRSTLSESIGNTFKRKNFNQFTDLECHAELCMAEALLMNALLTFIEDENLSSLIRGSLKVRQCYNSFKACEQIMKHRRWESDSHHESDLATLQTHFNSGVHMGIGTFNLMISLLPSRIVKILQFIGFTANKADGLNMLLTGNREKGLRQVLCSLTLLGYHLMVAAMISDRDRNVQLCHDILTTQLAKYPNGLWFLFFKGRLELIKGNLVEAELWYQKSLRSQQIWPQFHLLSYWELLWLNSLLGKWAEAEHYATNLLQKSNWSRTIYAYQLAAIKLTAARAKRLSADPRPDPSVDALMLEVPAYKQRIAGKSLPMEKFMVKRSVRYGLQNGNLVLPLIELMYLWNLFKYFSQNYNVADGILQLIDMELTSLSECQSHLYYTDNRALCLLLRGSCYRQMAKTALALQDLEECIAIGQSGGGLKEDLFLIPYAHVEAALCHEKTEAISMLQDVKKKFSGFALESRLHFRIHAALMDLNDPGFDSL